MDAASQVLGIQCDFELSRDVEARFQGLPGSVDAMKVQSETDDRDSDCFRLKFQLPL